MDKSEFKKFLAGACPESHIALDSHDTAQREALARVEAERDNAVQGAIKWSQRADIAQAQLAEAVGLLKFLEDEFQGFGSATRKISDFLARHAQAEQQEALSDAELMEVAMFEGSGNKAARRAHELGVAELPGHLAPRQKEAQGAQAGDETNIQAYQRGWDDSAALATQPAVPVTRRPIDTARVLELWEESQRCCNDGNALKFARAIEAESYSAVRGAEHDQ